MYMFFKYVWPPNVKIKCNKKVNCFLKLCLPKLYRFCETQSWVFAPLTKKILKQFFCFLRSNTCMVVTLARSIQPAMPKQTQTQIMHTHSKAQTTTVGKEEKKCFSCRKKEPPPPRCSLAVSSEIFVLSYFFYPSKK